jgi:hypothetical protein
MSIPGYDEWKTDSGREGEPYTVHCERCSKVIGEAWTDEDYNPGLCDTCEEELDALSAAGFDEPGDL